MPRSLGELSAEERSELGILAQLVTKGWRNTDEALHYARHPELKAHYIQLLEVDDWLEGEKRAGLLTGDKQLAEIVMAILGVLSDDKTTRDDLVDRLINT